MATKTQYWLMKTEPDEFSIHDLEKRPLQQEPWTGVRNYMARNFMRDSMRIGDGVLFYHSSTAIPGVAGFAKIASVAFPDPTAENPDSPYFDPKTGTKPNTWVAVQIQFVRNLKQVLSLTEIRKIPDCHSMALLQRGQRLSIQPVRPEEWAAILKASKAL